ncbi:3-oxoacyl-[acyl-carrier-protein] reductase FabG [Hydrogenophaga sp. T4]|nr:3-oxoacyl-[acyl-carrier-protein] reductase FabG [Hydrogenophaga sp. T4]
MTRALARELGSRNITVNCVAPGFIETDMTATLPEEQQKALLGQIPLGHLGKPADIAHAVAYLASLRPHMSPVRNCMSTVACSCPDGQGIPFHFRRRQSRPAGRLGASP